MCLFVTETLLTSNLPDWLWMLALCGRISGRGQFAHTVHMKQCLMSQEHTAFKQKTLKYRQQEHSDPEQIKHRRYVSW